MNFNKESVVVLTKIKWFAPVSMYEISCNWHLTFHLGSSLQLHMVLAEKVKVGFKVRSPPNYRLYSVKKLLLEIYLLNLKLVSLEKIC